jgi:hypothetical protein
VAAGSANDNTGARDGEVWPAARRRAQAWGSIALIAWLAFKERQQQLVLITSIVLLTAITVLLT